MRTNEPVPAPIESIWTSGMLSMKRAMSGVGVISKRPSVISAMSKQVPPMSVQRTFGELRSARASAWPPTTPPIGPETSVVASSFASIEIVPPCAAITRSSNAGARLLGLVADLLQRAARGLGGVGLDQGRVEPREVAAQRVELARRGRPAPRRRRPVRP